MAEIFTFSSTRKTLWAQKSSATLDTAPVDAIRAEISTLSSLIDTDHIGYSDWSNQELSDLYRAISALNQAGIRIETERGVTDEGDPWMVFCRTDGEVFIHFCRLAGGYLLDSPALTEPLRGNNFTALIDLFIKQASPASAPNVVAFRASKVLLHPAALLTILVWSLYISSGDLLGPVQAAELNPDDAPDAAGHGVQMDVGVFDAAAHAVEAVSVHLKDSPLHVKGAGPVEALTSDKVMARLFNSLENHLSGQTGGGASALQFVATVSAIAVALGVMDSHVFTAPLEKMEAEAATTPLHLGQQDAPDNVEAVDLGHQAGQFALADAENADAIVTHGEVGHVAQVSVETVPVQVEAATAAKPVGLVGDISEAFTPVRAVAVQTAVQDDKAAQPAIAFTPAVNDAPAQSDAVAPGAQSLAGNELTFLNATAPLAELQHFDIGGVSVVSSFNLLAMGDVVISAKADDVDASNGGMLQIDAPQLDTPPDDTADNGLAVFSDAIRDFINFFVSRGNVEIVASANEVMLIDLTAFDDTYDHAYARSWTLDDGSIISTVGHIEAFAQFHLV